MANKPAGSIVLLDEAYIHLSDSAEPGISLVAAGKDVIILRTFSKLYGMAGLRAGAALGRPDLLERIKGYGAGALPDDGHGRGDRQPQGQGSRAPKAEDHQRDPRRDSRVAGKQGYRLASLRSQHDHGGCSSTRKAFGEAMLKQKVAIGRTWPSMPNHVRVTIGTREEMACFKQAFARVMKS